MHHERNLIILSQAVEQANAEGMAFRLILVGDGTARGELDRFAAQSGGRIRVMPPIAHDEVPGVLAEAHIGVLPFPDEEKFRVSSPIKLFEYMAAGLPILATRIVCHTDVVGDSECVFWAEQAGVAGLLTAIRQAWQSRDLLSTMGARAVVAAQAWSWHASAQKLRLSLENGLVPHADGS